MSLLSEISRSVPIRDGLFEAPADAPPSLLISECQRCSSRFFPTEEMCPVCIVEGTLHTVRHDGRGRLVAHTVVRRGLPGFSSPYAMACVELVSGPSLLAQLEDWQEHPPAAGDPLALMIGTIKTEPDGTAIVGPKFRPVIPRS